jgi:DNA-directed RNA polymerase subunit RPC12/RpoP
MSLIQYRNCPHCGHGTWQEFVSLLPPAPSYWRCRECGDRRDAKRVSLGDEVLLPVGRIQTERACADVYLVDIGRGGARLRLPSEFPIPLTVGDRLLFNAKLQPFGELSRSLPATVRWRQGTDCGIAFARPLDLSDNDIMRIVKH